MIVSTERVQPSARSERARARALVLICRFYFCVLGFSSRCHTRSSARSRRNWTGKPAPDGSQYRAHAHSQTAAGTLAARRTRW